MQHLQLDRLKTSQAERRTAGLRCHVSTDVALDTLVLCGASSDRCGSRTCSLCNVHTDLNMIRFSLWKPVVEVQ